MGYVYLLRYYSLVAWLFLQRIRSSSPFRLRINFWNYES